MIPSNDRMIDHGAKFSGPHGLYELSTGSADQRPAPYMEKET